MAVLLHIFLGVKAQISVGISQCLLKGKRRKQIFKAKLLLLTVSETCTEYTHSIHLEVLILMYSLNVFLIVESFLSGGWRREGAGKRYFSVENVDKWLWNEFGPSHWTF